MVKGTYMIIFFIKT